MNLCPYQLKKEQLGSLKVEKLILGGEDYAPQSGSAVGTVLHGVFSGRSSPSTETTAPAGSLRTTMSWPVPETMLAHPARSGSAAEKANMAMTRGFMVLSNRH